MWVLIFGAILACSGGAENVEFDGKLIGILVSPDDVVLSVGGTTQLQAIGLLETREQVDITPYAQWNVADASLAAVSTGMDSEGQLQGLAVGKTQVSATLNGVESPNVSVTLTDAVLQRLTVNPNSLTLSVGDEVQLVASGLFSDGSLGEMTGQVRWVTGDGSVAQLDGSGVLTASGSGSTVVRAKLDGIESDPVDVSVSTGSGGSADLTVSGVSGVISGGSMTVSFTIANQGSGAATDFWIDLFVDPDSISNLPAYGDAYGYASYLGAGASVSGQFEVEVWDDSHMAVIYVDATNTVAESNESNNSDSAQIGQNSTTGKPDLTVTYFDYTWKDDELYYMVDVTNQGTGDAGFFYVDLFLHETGGVIVGEWGDEYLSFESLGAGETLWADFLVMDGCSYCESWVILDTYDMVDEASESNNIAGPLLIYP